MNEKQTHESDPFVINRRLSKLGTFESGTQHEDNAYVWKPNVPCSQESIVFFHVDEVSDKVAPALATSQIQGIVLRTGLDKFIDLSKSQVDEIERVQYIGVREPHEDPSLVRFLSKEVSLVGAEVILHKDKISAPMLEALSALASAPMEPAETTWVQFDSNLKPVENSLIASGTIDSSVVPMVSGVLKEMAELYPQDFYEGNYNAFSHELCNVSSEYRADEQDGIRLSVSGGVAEIPPFIRGYHVEAIRSFLAKTGVAQELGFEWEEFFSADIRYWEEDDSYRMDYFENSLPLKRVSFELDENLRDIEDLLAILVLMVVPDGWYADFMEKNGIELEDDSEMC